MQNRFSKYDIMLAANFENGASQAYESYNYGTGYQQVVECNNNSIRAGNCDRAWQIQGIHYNDGTERIVGTGGDDIFYVDPTYYNSGQTTVSYQGSQGSNMYYTLDEDGGDVKTILANSFRSNDKLNLIQRKFAGKDIEYGVDAEVDMKRLKVTPKPSANSVYLYYKPTYTITGTTSKEIKAEKCLEQASPTDTFKSWDTPTNVSKGCVGSSLAKSVAQVIAEVGVNVSLINTSEINNILTSATGLGQYFKRR